MKELLTTCCLKVGYKKNKVLSNIDLVIKSGEVVTILGANGIGKSTLIKTLTGEIPPIGGQVFVAGKPIENYTQKELSKHIAIVTTDKVQAGGLKVIELINLGRHPHTGYFGRLTDKDVQIVRKAMNDVVIAHKENSFLSELSDGERQKVMIARSIAQQTPIIILDEPFSFLDTASRIEILSLLKNICRTDDVGILLSSHDVSQAMRMSDRIVLIDKNREISVGTPNDLIRDNKIQNMFNNPDIIYDQLQSDFILK